MNAITRALTLAAACASLAVTAVPAAAADQMMDCSKASDMMMHPAMMPDSSPTSSGDVDADFRSMMVMHDGSMMKMAKMEVACGKDPKTVSAAKKIVMDAEARMQLFRNQGTSAQ